MYPEEALQVLPVRAGQGVGWGGLPFLLMARAGQWTCPPGPPGSQYKASGLPPTVGTKELRPEHQLTNSSEL